MPKASENREMSIIECAFGPAPLMVGFKGKMLPE